MAKALSDENLVDLRRLIVHLSKLPCESPQFAPIEKHIVGQLKRADSMYFLNTKDIDQAISSMADKFMFHGFFRHAEYLKLVVNRYIDKNLSESDLTPRLNVVKFLLCMSESPTACFWKHPEEFEFIRPVQQEEEVIDWGAFLNEGIETWKPREEDSSESSFDAEEYHECDQVDMGVNSRRIILQSEVVQKIDFKSSRLELCDSVQNTWFQTSMCMQPQSLNFQANVGILWEKYLEKEAYGLVKIAPITVISEYKVMREIMWQLWGPHTSTVFKLDRNRLLCREDVTIASVRTDTFYKFMVHFLSYIELLDDFRIFQTFLNTCESTKIPVTYRCYAQSLQRITSPVFKQFVELEDEIREQETSMTLLKLIKRLEEIFKPLFVLKQVHLDVTEDLTQKSPLNCALNLLVRLRKSLEYCVDKSEQDVRLVVYLESLFHYLNMIDGWLVKNDLSDYSQEFVIEK